MTLAPGLTVHIAEDSHTEELNAFLETIRRELGIHVKGHDLHAVATQFERRGGAMLLLRRAGTLVGSIGFDRFDDGIYEIRNVYLAPHLRGQGVGRLLLEGVLGMLRDLGAKHVQLETRTYLRTAGRLYGSLGFRPVPPYRPVGSSSAIYLRRELCPQFRRAVPA